MASEVDAAKAAASAADSDAPTIFDKIISGDILTTIIYQGDIPATIIYQDDDALAFRDITPQAPTHFLVIPKKRAGLTRLCKATEESKPLLGHLLFVAQKVAMQGESCCC
eukprot:gene5905-33476_t